MTVYEVSYLLAGVPEDAVAAEADGIKKIVTDNGGELIADEAPKLEKLAYTMRRKLVSGSYQKYDEAHFGWVKFEISSGKIEAVKKAIELLPNVLRMLVITTVRESTYLGKRAPAVAAAFVRKPFGTSEAEAVPAAKKEVVKPAEPATVEEMDKSIDEMVKEV